MSTLKNIQTRLGFWFYKYSSPWSNGMVSVLMVFAGLCSFILSVESVEEDRQFLDSLPFIILAVVCFVVCFIYLLITWKMVWDWEEDNYLITISEAEKFREKLNSEGTMTNEVSSKLLILVLETRVTKNPKKLNAWIENFQA